MSTGPIVAWPGCDPVMFYNGATHDARWRIGWITFDRDFGAVTGRGLEPLIMPPPAEDRSATDIAFAASIVLEDERAALYYSVDGSQPAAGDGATLRLTGAPATICLPPARLPAP